MRSLPEFLELVDNLEKAVENKVQVRTSSDRKLKKQAEIDYTTAHNKLRDAIWSLY